MKRWYLFVILLAMPAIVLAQYNRPQNRGQYPLQNRGQYPAQNRGQYPAQNRGQSSVQGGGQYPTTLPYEPVVPPPSVTTAYGAYPNYGEPGYNTPGTAAGSALNGMGNVISAAGNYNLATSAAAVNMTQAQSNEIKNHQQYENTYFSMRQANQAYQKSQEGPRPTQEEMVRMAREAAPKPPDPSQVNPASGAINWPDALMEDSFGDERTGLQQLMTKKTTYGRISISEQNDARKTIEDMFGELKSQITQIPTKDYLDARNCLRSLIYALASSDLQ